MSINDVLFIVLSMAVAVAQWLERMDIRKALRESNGHIVHPIQVSCIPTLATYTLDPAWFLACFLYGAEWLHTAFTTSSVPMPSTAVLLLSVLLVCTNVPNRYATYSREAGRTPVVLVIGVLVIIVLYTMMGGRHEWA